MVYGHGHGGDSGNGMMDGMMVLVAVMMVAVV
jgi:hypothetical protein